MSCGYTSLSLSLVLMYPSPSPSLSLSSKQSWHFLDADSCTDPNEEIDAVGMIGRARPTSVCCPGPFPAPSTTTCQPPRQRSLKGQNKRPNILGRAYGARMNLGPTPGGCGALFRAGNRAGSILCARSIQCFFFRLGYRIQREAVHPDRRRDRMHVRILKIMYRLRI